MDTPFAPSALIKVSPLLNGISSSWLDFLPRHVNPLKLMMTTLPKQDLLLKLCFTASALFLFATFLVINDPHLQHRIRLLVPLEKSRKDVFIEQTLSSTIDGEYDGQALNELCSKTNWTEGLIFSCYGLEGGLGNVRNIFLNCIRYAIEAGASFVIPKITARSAKYLTALKTEDYVDFSTFFDRDHLISSLRQGCPQMRLYNDSNDLWDQPTTASPLVITPKNIAEDFVNLNFYDVLTKPEKWRGHFDSWLGEQLNATSRSPPSDANPLLVTVNQPFMDFPTSYDSRAFIANFGLILRFRPDIRRIAATALHALSDTYSLNINPLTGITQHAYLGAHLRTAIDASSAGWTAYPDQAACYLSQARAQNLSLIYVASGDADSTARFKRDALAHNIRATTKHDLLSGEDLDAVERLAWDQQALIDYELLLRSSSFAGIYQSSFAWNVALRRHVAGKSYRWDAMEGVGGQTFDDEYSWIYGPPGAWRLFEAAMWP